jgi:hypothetical protein
MRALNNGDKPGRSGKALLYQFHPQAQRFKITHWGFDAPSLY